MKVEVTSPGVFALKELTLTELEIIQEALINFDSERLKLVEDLKPEETICAEMYGKIDSELIKSRY